MRFSSVLRIQFGRYETEDPFRTLYYLLRDLKLVSLRRKFVVY